MSLALPSIEKTRIVMTVDPRIDFSQDGVYAIGASGERVTYRNIQTQNFSASNISIVDNQSMGIGIASKWFMKVTFEVDFSGVPPVGAYLLQLGSNDAARFMPLTSITKSASLTLNNATFTQNINEYHDALMRYNESADYMGFDLSGCPSFIDTYQSYNDYLTYGSALNPLGNYGENSVQEPLRGGFDYVFVTPNQIGDGVTTKTCKIRFTTREPILVSPLTWGHYNTKALIGIRNFNVNYTFDSNITRLWSHNPNNGVANFAITSVVPVFSSLELIYITPKSTIPVSPIQRWPLSKVYLVSKRIGTVAANSVQPVVSDSMPLSGVPRRIYIFARRSNNSRTFNDPDVFGLLDNLNIYFNNVDGNFSQATTQQLYQVSRENGYRRSYQAFTKFEGSVMCVDFGKDMPLLAAEAVGSNENIQFQYQGNLHNLADVDIDFTLYTVVISEGVMTNVNGTIDQDINVITPKDVIDAKLLQMLPHEREIDYLAVGGSFGSAARKFLTQAKDIGKKVVDVGSKAYAAIPDSVKKDLKTAALGTVEAISPRIGTIIKDYGPVAADLYHAFKGKGYSEDQIYNEFIGMGYHPKKGKKACSGGERMTQKELHKLLKR